MKTLVSIFLALAMTAVADDLPLKDGSVLRNVSIISAEPGRMLIVHDGGGVYVAYSSLATNALTSAQRGEVELMIKAHVTRERRLEDARAVKYAEERSMREGGFMLFEGYWMQPSDIESLLAARKIAALERQKLRLEIAKRQAELDAVNERAKWLLEGEPRRSTVFISTGYGPRRYGGPYNWGYHALRPVKPRPRTK